MERLTCANCGKSLDKHCKKHTVPCCPGKCPDDKKPWPKKYLNLTPRYRRIINNFFGTLGPNDLHNAMNWSSDCDFYKCPANIRHYQTMRDLYRKHGPIPEK